ncbi:hypothetical protein FB45DRAFT_910934 [Roridomyces roridus]|uniref:Arylamine N-acetyltransferase n=1 Tax=Roridomyces roridus TaxID=1738132 RepID=A0AAD7C030_9AGAR|nr:hypothetical protein FB45DRAFT_910934 [Roridomyces roridus]
MASNKGFLRDGLWIKRTQSVYTPAQVSRWLSKIQYPGSVSGFQPDLDSLTHLLRLSAATFPFENTPMHYTPGHSMDISAEGLYERMVEGGGGEGSYCFGLNSLFLQMIRALGFRAYATAGRINRETSWHLEPAFLSVGHMIIFVQPTEGSNETYVLDVGYGPVRPILLEEGAKIMGATPSETYTLVRTARADSSLGETFAARRTELYYLFQNHLQTLGSPQKSNGDSYAAIHTKTLRSLQSLGSCIPSSRTNSSKPISTASTIASWAGARGRSGRTLSAPSTFG